MLARSEGPGAGHLDGNTEGVGGKGFYDGDRAAVTEVSVQESAKPNEALWQLDTDRWEERYDISLPRTPKRQCRLARRSTESNLQDACIGRSRI